MPSATRRAAQVSNASRLDAVEAALARISEPDIARALVDLGIEPRPSVAAAARLRAAEEAARAADTARFAAAAAEVGRLAETMNAVARARSDRECWRQPAQAKVREEHIACLRRRLDALDPEIDKEAHEALEQQIDRESLPPVPETPEPTIAEVTAWVKAQALRLFPGPVAVLQRDVWILHVLSAEGKLGRRMYRRAQAEAALERKN